MNRPDFRSPRRTARALGLALAAVAALAVAAPRPAAAQATVRLAYVAWDDCVATSAVMQTLLEDALGRTVRLTEASAGEMWRQVADGEADGHLCGWLPVTHGRYIDRHRDAVENLGPHIPGGARIGLVVPDYVSLRAIDDLRRGGDQVENRIVGIDPESGLMAKTAKVLKDYALPDLTLVEGSGDAMAAALGDAIAARRPIVVTGWTPHWKFGVWRLRYLDDPLEVYGGDEVISTIVRRTLATDQPALHRVLDRFRWDVELLQGLMADIHDGARPGTAARRFLRRHPDLVRRWTRL